MKEIIGINLIGLLINNLIPKSYHKSRDLGMLVSIITLYLILGKIFVFNHNSLEYQDRIEILSFCFGLDGLGLGLLGLIGTIEPIIMILVKGERKEIRRKKKNNK